MFKHILTLILGIAGLLLAFSFSEPTQALGAAINYQKELIPITTNTYYVGTTSSVWKGGHFNELCLSGSCISSWLAGGGGGGGGTTLYIQNGGATQNVATTTLNFTPNSFSLTESPDDTFSIRVSTTTLGLLASSISDFVSTVRTSISETITGIGYDSGTGIFSLDSGYTIPTTTRANNWDTAYGWGNHASAGYLANGTHWTMTGTVLSYMGGNIGIGTTTPAEKLVVSATGYDARVTVDGTGTLGTAFPGLEFKHNGSESVRALIRSDYDNPGANLTFFTSNGSPAEAMRIDKLGNVGIGTSTPSSLLSIASTATGYTNFNQSSGTSYNQIIGPASATAGNTLLLVQSKGIMGSGGSIFRAITSAGVGIRVAESGAFYGPSAASFASGGGANISLGGTNNTNTFSTYNSGSHSATDFLFKAGTTDRTAGNLFQISNYTAPVLTVSAVTGGGNVGIGSSSPSRLLTVSGDIYSTGNITAASSTLGNATSTSLAITGISGSTQCLRVNSSGVVSGTGSDCASGADGMSNWSLVNGALTPTTTTATYGIRVNASSTIGGGTAVTGLTISGGATTTGNHLIMGSATSTTSFFSALGTFTNSVVNTLLTAAAATFTGLVDIGAGVLEIPNGTGPTVDSIGELALDSTSNQLVLYGTEKKVIGNGNIYSSFTYATSTDWTGTTTIPLGTARVAETWNDIQCFTDAGTLNVSIYDGTNRMNANAASTTVGTTAFSTNNTFTAGEKRYVDVGTPASSPTKISCTVSKSLTSD